MLYQLSYTRRLTCLSRHFAFVTAPSPLRIRHCGIRISRPADPLGAAGIPRSGTDGFTFVITFSPDRPPWWG
jgi:hypothetical protein